MQFLDEVMSMCDLCSNKKSKTVKVTLDLCSDCDFKMKNTISIGKAFEKHFNPTVKESVKHKDDIDETEYIG